MKKNLKYVTILIKVQKDFDAKKNMENKGK